MGRRGCGVSKRAVARVALIGTSIAAVLLAGGAGRTWK
jgi:hypothetical protein